MAVVRELLGKKPQIGTGTFLAETAVVIGDVVMGDHVLIGMGAIVMDDCLVESNSIIGAGSVVTQGTHIKSGEVWAGAPARKIKDISADLLEGEVNRIADNYVKYASWYEPQPNTSL